MKHVALVYLSKALNWHILSDRHYEAMSAIHKRPGYFLNEPPNVVQSLERNFPTKVVRDLVEHGFISIKTEAHSNGDLVEHAYPRKFRTYQNTRLTVRVLTYGALTGMLVGGWASLFNFVLNAWRFWSGS